MYASRCPVGCGQPTPGGPLTIILTISPPATVIVEPAALAASEKIAPDGVSVTLKGVFSQPQTTQRLER